MKAQRVLNLVDDGIPESEPELLLLHEKAPYYNPLKAGSKKSNLIFRKTY
jgi:hypothetical protein